jgi:hypothetical protein
LALYQADYSLFAETEARCRHLAIPVTSDQPAVAARIADKQTGVVTSPDKLAATEYAMGIGRCLRKPRTVGQSLSGISVPYLHFLQSSLPLAALYIARPIAVLSAAVLVRMTEY